MSTFEELRQEADATLERVKADHAKSLREMGQELASEHVRANTQFVRAGELQRRAERAEETLRAAEQVLEAAREVLDYENTPRRAALSDLRTALAYFDSLKGAE